VRQGTSGPSAKTDGRLRIKSGVKPSTGAYSLLMLYPIKPFAPVMGHAPAAAGGALRGPTTLVRILANRFWHVSGMIQSGHWWSP
jgi:hypothetical protein